jgi:hypothetical protein
LFIREEVEVNVSVSQAALSIQSVLVKDEILVALQQ